LATVLANIQPLIATVLGYFVLNERLGPRCRMGLLLGFAGILLVAFPSLSVDGANSSLSGLGYILLGAVGVAVGNVLLKQLTGQVDLLMATGWQFILGSIVLFALSQRVEAPVRVIWDPSFIAILLVLGILGTAVAFALWFSLLHRSELNRLNTFTFLTPTFGLMIGMFFFGERLNLLEIIGVTLILGAVVWISRSSDTTN
jgi:drug/metabolite transporter (DMT)-like permease